MYILGILYGVNVKLNVYEIFFLWNKEVNEG